MSNEEYPDQQGQHGQQGHSEGPDPRYGGWEPTPQGDGYDADATAFVHLPPEDLANIPLAAPGQGYVPPMILPLTPAAGLDPAATGSWVLQTQTQQAQTQQARTEQRAQEADAQQPGAVHWPDPNQQGGQVGYQGPYQDTSHATAQWNFTEGFGGTAVPEAPTAPEATATAPEAGSLPEAGHFDHPERASHDVPVDHTGPTGHAGHDVPADHTTHADHAGHTGQWTIPVADGDLPDESGEFLASAHTPHTPQWYADSARPATLPGGAAAPWATPEPEPKPEPEPAAEPGPMAEQTPEAEPASGEPTTDEPATGEPAEQTAQATAAEPSAPADTEGPATPADTEGPATEEAGTAPDAAPAPEADVNAAPSAAPETDPLPDPTPDPMPEAEAGVAPAAVLLDAPSQHPSASYLLHVNGVDRPVADAWIGESLLYVLRERLGLAGAKDGCSQGECGACNVQVDGRLVASCLVPAATAAGSEVRTVEGLAVDGEPSDVQRALSACGAVQCGFCIPGMAMTVHDLLEGNHAPSELETRQALCGNLCRCSGYRGVLDAVADVVAAREASAEAATAAQDEARIPHQAEPGAGGVQQGPHPHEGEAL
ncbi:2Fe-2S iron-sulfur cluster-binding protein [Streptomyces sp. NPDC017546]|uniref:2Fe-2S iron-sulfur cluster-binding protein n=1 Tax=unclassified Streptomyces TaxID=2593676 RepID=UPI002360C6C5|nr:2Fe-2S iron-sulfur cluster-binding protein [Streptomyces sp. MMBL 11-1]